MTSRAQPKTQRGTEAVSMLQRRYLVREASALYASPISRCVMDPATMTREDRLIARAKKVLSRRLGEPGAVFDSPKAVRDFLVFELAEEAREVFYAIFLDAQNRVVSCEPLFVGTLTQTSVYPREVIRRCIELNASAVILAHNHPSGVTEPSTADRAITNSLTSALALIDVRVLDHFIVGGTARPVSFAERGLL